ncbi:MAG: hypothetical protein HY016_04085 [Nitrosomonadales bacterium]|nr:hypothetical protein [Nitrosomonadales bacterium]
MSLLLDARKKSQLAQSAQDRDAAQAGMLPNSAPTPEHAATSTAPTAKQARSAGQNLFSAKLQTAPFAQRGIHRNILIALGSTVLLLTLWAGYVWYTVSADAPRTSIKTTGGAPLAKPVPSALPPGNLVPGMVSSQPAAPAPPAHAAPPAGKTAPHRAAPKIAAAPSHTKRRSHASQLAAETPHARDNTSPPGEPHRDESIDLILNNAYIAYRGGHYLQAQQLYQDALHIDERNIDARLGMAATAQHRGADSLAAHYYAQALALDPRNAVANAGMSALTIDSNRISRLKTLLNEQPDSSSLHFALGDRYAEQDRWAEAHLAYFKAYQLEPNNAELTFNLAVSLDHLGQAKPAAQYYRQALQLDPDRSVGFDHAQISQRIDALMR